MTETPLFSRSVLALVLVLTACGDDDGGTSPDAGSPPGPTTLCTNTCGPAGSPGEWAGDGACDDGGEGAMFNECALGTDCMDCGERTTNVPTPDAGADSSTPPVPDSGTPPTPDAGMMSRDAGADVDDGPFCDPSDTTTTFQCADVTCTVAQICSTTSVAGGEPFGTCTDVPERCLPCSSQFSFAPRCAGGGMLSGSSIEGCTFACRI